MAAKYMTDTEVAERYGVSRCTIWRWSKASDFPSPIQLPGRTTRWAIEQLDAYDQAKLEAA